MTRNLLGHERGERDEVWLIYTFKTILVLKWIALSSYSVCVCVCVCTGGGGCWSSAEKMEAVRSSECFKMCVLPKKQPVNFRIYSVPLNKNSLSVYVSFCVIFACYFLNDHSVTRSYVNDSTEVKYHWSNLHCPPPQCSCCTLTQMICWMAMFETKVQFTFTTNHWHYFLHTAVLGWTLICKNLEWQDHNKVWISFSCFSISFNLLSVSWQETTCHIQHTGKHLVHPRLPTCNAMKASNGNNVLCHIVLPILIYG
jgi:hypothetical protein